jgi:hypothetical protein
MRVDVFAEPELDFGSGRHIDIRFGLMDYGPLDYFDRLVPREIRVGVVGTPETVEGVEAWLQRCRTEIPGKDSRQPHLFPRFPGFNADCAFRSTLALDRRLQRAIPEREFELLAKASSLSWIARQAVGLFHSELEHLADAGQVDVVVCAVPAVLLDVFEGSPEGSDEEDALDEQTDEPDAIAGEKDGSIDFHHLLKASAMSLRIPIQLVLPATYDKAKKRLQKRRPDRVRQLQDEATRAWNFHTALYYKAGGVPWRLARESNALTTCHVGVCFYKTLDGSSLLTSMAQIFNERGDGVIVRGAKAAVSKEEDRQPHLAEGAAFDLLDSALTTYRSEHKTLPARVVVHKSSIHSEEELAGFEAALRTRGVDAIDCLSIRRGNVRLFRRGQYPPLRGTLLHLGRENQILYTRGSVDFYATYPGMYIPRPLEIRCELTEQTPNFLAQEILALTKMNWNKTQFDGAEPITLHAARRVGGILKYVDEGQRVEPRYGFYM